MTNKYNPPLMKDVCESSERRLFTVISTFAGCGGSSTGYRLAGGKVLVANEFIPAAISCYKANYPDTIVLPEDIRKLRGEDFLNAAKLNKGELDIFDGSPPCASFSMAGAREEHWGKVKKYSDTKQRVDDLFFEYARILNEIQPKVFVAENVKGLTIGSATDILGSDQFDMFNDNADSIIDVLNKCGYWVHRRVLNASHYGVPQGRERLIIVGVRSDLGIEPSYPQQQNSYFTLQDALNISDKEEDYSYCSMEKYAVGKQWHKLKIGEQSEKYFQLVKPSLDSPCPTITASGGHLSIASVTHPLQCRKFSISELKAIQSFPQDFILNGTYEQNYERIGRSVPPLMMKAIAENIYTNILLRI